MGNDPILHFQLDLAQIANETFEPAMTLQQALPSFVHLFDNWILEHF